MAILFESVFLDVLVLLASLSAAIYFYVTRNFNYWKKRGILFLKPIPFVGTFKKTTFGEESIGDHLKNIHLQIKDQPYVGLMAFDQPILLVKDLDLVRNVLVRDSQNFINRIFSPDETVDPLGSKTLFSLGGQRWKHMRVKLSPTFTSGKMKNMFHLVNEVGKRLAERVTRNALEDGILQTKDTTARFTTDVIASCAFGIETNTLNNEESEFRTNLRRLMEFSLFRAIKTVMSFFNPGLLKTFRLRLFDPDIMDFLRKTVWDIVDHREKNNIVRNDFVDILTKLRNENKIDKGDATKEQTNNVEAEKNKTSTNGNQKIVLDDDDLVAQAFAFLTAGFETSSTTMTLALYELALQPELQNRLRVEIKSVLQKNGGSVTYDAMQEMTYLDMVVSETLRKHPPLGFLDRRCLNSYTIPGTIPGTSRVLEPGTAVFVSVSGIQYDPQFYPEPDRFDPERFNVENKRQRTNYTYMPFGEGPRNCIGERFGLMQTKSGLIHILRSFEVSPCKDTPIPLVIDNKSFLTAAVGQVPLTVKASSVN